MALGLMLTEARLTGTERALVIGAGTGYAAAVLARLVADVVALEESPASGVEARAALAPLGVEMIEGAARGGLSRRRAL